MLLLAIKPELLMHIPEGGQLIWILLIVVVLFGGKKIPELAKGIGKGIRDFNAAKDGVKTEIEASLKPKEETPKV